MITLPSFFQLNRIPVKVKVKRRIQKASIQGEEADLEIKMPKVSKEDPNVLDFQVQMLHR